MPIQIIVRGERKGRPGGHTARGGGNLGFFHGRSCAQQEAVNKKMIESLRKRAEDVARRRRGTRRKDGEVRLVGSIPAELHNAEIRSSNNPLIWVEKGDELLRKHGLRFKS